MQRHSGDHRFLDPLAAGVVPVRQAIEDHVVHLSEAAPHLLGQMVESLDPLIAFVERDGVCQPVVVPRERAHAEAFDDLAASHPGLAGKFDSLVKAIGFFSPGISVPFTFCDWRVAVISVSEASAINWKLVSVYSMLFCT